MNLLHQATVISMSLVRLVVAAMSQQYIVIFSMLFRKQDTGLTHSKDLCLMLLLRTFNSLSRDGSNIEIVTSLVTMQVARDKHNRRCQQKIILFYKN